MKELKNIEIYADKELLQVFINTTDGWTHTIANVKIGDDKHHITLDGLVPKIMVKASDE